MSTDQHAENLYGEERHLIQRAEREKRLVFFCRSRCIRPVRYAVMVNGD